MQAACLLVCCLACSASSCQQSSSSQGSLPQSVTSLACIALTEPVIHQPQTLFDMCNICDDVNSESLSRWNLWFGKVCLRRSCAYNGCGRTNIANIILKGAGTALPSLQMRFLETNRQIENQSQVVVGELGKYLGFLDRLRIISERLLQFL